MFNNIQQHNFVCIQFRKEKVLYIYYIVIQYFIILSYLEYYIWKGVFFSRGIDFLLNFVVYLLNILNKKPGNHDSNGIQ
jgi:hypothetical protein